MNRQFLAPRPNLLRLSDFPRVASWQSFVHLAFSIGTYGRRIVRWRVSRTAHAGFVLDALEQALHDRWPFHGAGLVYRNDRGVRYVSILYAERLAESVIGLPKTEVIRCRGPWQHVEAVEFATLGWMDWFNNRRLAEPVGPR
ncbi:hypothetical protein E2C06_23625 [Dankookia rubra]|uniref:Integrase catalytic domain-containing protein n=1 Tax=Dankookia rubra TaxID=1442381 RepID=A0A4R5QCR4_9PROT|nr:hypothetical protein E2C06_23625 [Dankookia rubra]